MRTNVAWKNVCNLVRNAKKDYARDSIERNRNNSTKMWKNLKLLLPKGKKNTITSVRDPINGTILHGIDAANCINGFFADIGTELNMLYLFLMKTTWIISGLEFI